MPSILKHHYALPILSIAVLTSLCAVLAANSRFTQNADTQVLRIHCAAGIKNAIDPAIHDFIARTGIEVEVTFGGSGVLLSDFRTRPSGVDLFIAADDQYTQSAKDFGLIEKSAPLARMQPVLAFPKENPHNIGGIEDLLGKPIRLALANPDTAAIGKCTQQALATSGYWETISSQVTVYKPTVNELANDLKLNAVDVAITWDATARQYPEIDFVHSPEFADAGSTVSAGISTRTNMPDAAQLLMNDLTDATRGGMYFEAWGYTPLTSNEPLSSTRGFLP